MLYTGRRPPTEFRDELQKYPWPRSSAIKAHGKRWIDACRTDPTRQEKIWQRVSREIPDLSPEDFIKFVTRARSRAAGLPAFLEQDAKGWPTAEELKQILKRTLSSKKSLSDIADVLEQAAFSIRIREQFSETYREGLPANIDSRKKDRAAQRLRAFCMIMSAFFYERCSKWLDEEVGVLADIALARRGITSIESVKQFRDGLKSIRH